MKKKTLNLYKIYLVVFFSVMNVHALYSQKEQIDTSVFGRWPLVGNADISNSGEYVWYTVNNQPIGSSNVFFKNTNNNNWNFSCIGFSNPVFSEDSHTAYFMKTPDSLCLLTLGTSFREYIPNVKSFQVIKSGDNEWLIYKSNSSNKELVTRNMLTGKTNIFSSISNYVLNSDRKVLVLEADSISDNISMRSLKWVELSSGKTVSIWQGLKIQNIVFSKNGTQLAFTVEQFTGNQKQKSIWYYKEGMDKAILIADDHTTVMDDDLQLDNTICFNKSNTGIFVYLKEKDAEELLQSKVRVDVWNYLDTELQSQQLKKREGKSYVAIVPIHNSRIIRLQNKNEIVVNDLQKADDFLLVNQIEGDADYGERNWNKAFGTSTLYLVSTSDGGREAIRKLEKEFGNCYLSPEGNFVVYYEPKLKNYFSYEVSDGVIKNITKNISTIWTDNSNEDINSEHAVYSIHGWLSGDSAVLIRDQWDVWLVFLKSNKAAINLTNGFGRRGNIFFQLMNIPSGNIISSSQKVIFTAFNRDTKNNGFYTKSSLYTKGDPTLLLMDSCVFHIEGPHGYPSKKARDAEVYLLRRERTSEAPNYFSTTDFKKLFPISDIYPEKKYNWVKSELITWRTFNGTNSQGVLYLPENFDRKKKYPIVFDIYEKRSDELNSYKFPELAGDRINIPWFVSKGYIVFTPDIHYIIGKPGQSAYNSVVSAAKYLAKFSWVDSERMGIQGHSFGGYEVNYIISHTKVFAAAISASSVSNQISGYGAIAPYSGASRQFMYEVDQSRLGVSLWQAPDLYIENSPIFQADKIHSPLLMMNNKDDGIVPFAQGVEFFTALRRLGRKVWMLQYDDETHSISDGKAKLDYTIRMIQFFDHYLKDSACPRWMLYGIPAKDKGVETGYELVKEKDKNGKWLTPQPGGLLTDEEKKKVEALKHRKPITVTIK